MNDQQRAVLERIRGFLEEEERANLPYFLSKIRELENSEKQRESFFFFASRSFCSLQFF